MSKLVATLIVASALLVSGCGTSSRSSAVTAMRQWVGELAANADAQWDTMVPEQQKQVAESSLGWCNEQLYLGNTTGEGSPSVRYVSTVSARRVAVRAYAGQLGPATVVSAKIEVGKTVSVDTVTWFDLGGAWRWALSKAAVASYLSSSCPMLASIGSPPVTPTTAPTTTTVPLVAAANVRVQALNGLLTGSLAADLNARLKTDGYKVLAANNAALKVSATSIYVLTAGFVPEADALASALGLARSVVVDTVPPPSSAPIPKSVIGHADLVVVIGSDLAARLVSTSATTG